MERDPTSGRRAQSSRRAYSPPQPTERPHGSRRRDDRQTVRRVSHEARDRRTSKAHATEEGLSQEKLNQLNKKFGWSSEDSPEPSPGLDIEKQRTKRARNDEARHGQPKLRKRSDEKRGSRRMSESRQQDRSRSGRRREVTDDFYYRNKLGHQRINSGKPLVTEDRGRQRNSRSTHRKTHRRRSRDVEKAAAARRKRRRRKWIATSICVGLLLVLIIGLAVGISQHKRHHQPTTGATNSSLASISQDSIPPWARGTYLDPFTWYDTNDFNLTFTNETIGGLPIMGLDTSFDNSAKANPTVPALSDPWPYPDRPVRGVNIGGWLSLEPFMLPSLFNTTLNQSASSYQPPYRDEWTLSSALGPEAAKSLLDSHYSQFANRSTFEQIRAAGFDHVRIPFPYWAVTTYPGDPYVARTSWRYLLRGIEYARQNGLRVNLDLHSAPGSQNGWNHSGREGPIGWLNGTDGQLNADRTLQIHDQLSAFFAQDRYKGVVTMYGILNEPRMIFLDTDAVVNWTASAIRQIRASPLPNDTILIFSDGFESLPYWKSAFESYSDIIPPGSNAAEQRLLVDSHEYVIFNRDQLMLNHSAKLDFACNGWSQQVQQSMDPNSGFGSFICGEWSQADTDCAGRLNPEGVGNRWEGTLQTGNTTTSVLVPSCPLVNQGHGQQCQCEAANADPSSYSEGYKTWLSNFADAQMRSFARGWGSFYWTWDVEDGVSGAAQWSWKKGMEAGILPKNIAEGGTSLWQCDGSGTDEDWVSMGLGEDY